MDMPFQSHAETRKEKPDLSRLIKTHAFQPVLYQPEGLPHYTLLLVFWLLRFHRRVGRLPRPGGVWTVRMEGP